MEISQKQKSETLLAAMRIINRGGIVIPGSREHRIVTDVISSKIDSLGPEEALKEVEEIKEPLIAQMEQMTM
jgi:hypothetical protein